MKAFASAVLVAGVLAGAPAHAQDKEAALKELAPTGQLRVAIAVSPAPSALYAIKDPASGQYRGVTIDLGMEFGKMLCSACVLVPYLAFCEITEAPS